MSPVVDYETLSYDVADGILTLTLNRPDQLNAFTVTMARELVAAFNRASADDEVKAVVVTGSGRAFCAGMDLSVGGNVFGLDENAQPTLEDVDRLIAENSLDDQLRDTGGTVTLAIYDCTKPVIAAINGPAVGIGATMTLAMDVRLASTKARIGFVFGKIGIVPEACSTWFLPRIVGMSRALELVYSADILPGAEALEVGLVRSVHEPEDLLPAAYELARKFTQNRSPVATAITRQMMYRNSAKDHPVEAHRIDTLGVYYQSLEDGKEGIAAFLEKRDADFSGASTNRMPPYYPWW